MRHTCSPYIIYPTINNPPPPPPPSLAPAEGVPSSGEDLTKCGVVWLWLVLDLVLGSQQRSIRWKVGNVRTDRFAQTLKCLHENLYSLNQT